VRRERIADFRSTREFGQQNPSAWFGSSVRKKLAPNADAGAIAARLPDGLAGPGIPVS
jgi:hypothetical protein